MIYFKALGFLSLKYLWEDLNTITQVDKTNFSFCRCLKRFGCFKVAHFLSSTYKCRHIALTPETSFPDQDKCRHIGFMVSTHCTDSRELNSSSIFDVSTYANHVSTHTMGLMKNCQNLQFTFKWRGRVSNSPFASFDDRWSQRRFKYKKLKWREQSYE